MNAPAGGGYESRGPRVGFASSEMDQDKPISSGPTFLSRNKTEKTRLQGLMHTMTSLRPQGKQDVKGTAQKFAKWMVNEGQ